MSQPETWSTVPDRGMLVGSLVEVRGDLDMQIFCCVGGAQKLEDSSNHLVTEF